MEAWAQQPGGLKFKPNLIYSDSQRQRFCPSFESPLRFQQQDKKGPSHEGPICLGSLGLGEFFDGCDLCRISTNLWVAPWGTLLSPCRPIASPAFGAYS
jgi:hypothetical protein